MIKLSELSEQAKFIAEWYGADWSSALCQDKDGNQDHEIICESREESVISTGSKSNEASWLCDYLEMCSPENIISIAKYVAELEQRLNATAQPVSDGWVKCSERMPPIGKRVLIPTSGLGEAIEAVRYESNKFNRFGVEVVADYWMPLPAAPGGQ